MKITTKFTLGFLFATIFLMIVYGATENELFSNIGSITLIVFFVSLVTGFIAKKTTRDKKLGIDKTEYFGEYITGLTTHDFKEDQVKCGSNEQSFIFMKRKKVLGTIDKQSITNVTLEDASSMEKRVTATRMLAVGLFAFAFKKKKKHRSHFVVVEYEKDGLPVQAVFHFEGKMSSVIANKAANFIRNNR